MFLILIFCDYYIHFMELLSETRFLSNYMLFILRNHYLRPGFGDKYTFLVVIVCLSLTPMRDNPLCFPWSSWGSRIPAYTSLDQAQE